MNNGNPQSPSTDEIFEALVPTEEVHAVFENPMPRSQQGGLGFQTFLDQEVYAAAQEAIANS
ncbi:MAG TPA: hypothetical protein VNG90_02055 [Candidatus Acidoferrum sp.]|nr:hypothetical protein [Candidatus Acidoferrum sp.]